MTARCSRNRSSLWLPRAGLRLGLASLLLIVGGRAVHDATASNETRTLSFHHTHSDEDLTVTFKRNGRYDEDALKQLNHFLRDWRTQDQTVMDPHLFDILWEVYRDVDGKEPIQIVSAYRSPATNAMLRRRSAHSGVARFSQHMLGHAMDFYIPSVPLEEIRFAGLRLQRGGVGFYPTSGSPFVHLDTGSIRHWPRMSRQELARVFPDGRTVYIPSDGVPMKGYDLALADIQHRDGGAGEAPTTGRAKSFLASLFGSKSSDDEDEAEAPRTVTVSDATMPAKPAAAAAAAVPLPRMRPATYQVASASDAAPAPKPGLVGAVRQTIADIINARGLWSDDSAPKQPTEALKAASLKARFASTFAEVTATANAVKVKPWSADDKPQVKPQTLAYAPPAPAVERTRVVTASAPIPHSIRPVVAGAPVKVDLVVAKGPQPVPANLAPDSPKLADPWTRAMMLAPNFQYAMLATPFGDQDMTLLRSLFVKPATTISMAFADDPTPGLACDRFAGSATAPLTTTAFGLQTAILQQ